MSGIRTPFPFLAIALLGMMNARADLPMDAAEGSGRIRLADGRPAIRFEADASRDSSATWRLTVPLEPGWYTVSLGLSPQAGSRKLFSVEWLDASGSPVLSVDSYHTPNPHTRDSQAVFGVWLARGATAVRLRKNQERAVPSTPVVSLGIVPGRPAPGIAFMEAVDATFVSGDVLLPKNLGAGLMRAVSSRPLALKWMMADGQSFETPPGTETPVFLEAPLSGIFIKGSPSGAFCVEHRFESESPVDKGVLSQQLISLYGSGKQVILIDVWGKGLDPRAVMMADFPGGARMAAVQSWDDGLPGDKRIAGMLRKNGWRASFFLNRNSPILDGVKELESLGMEVGSHSWSHPPYWLQTPQRCHDESMGMRLLLESKLGHPVVSFAYPFQYRPAYDARGDFVLRAQEEAGHLSCRTTTAAPLSLDDIGNPFAMSPCGHFLMSPERIDAAWNRAAATPRGVFYIWGHSYELPGETEWASYENLLVKYSRRPEAWYASQGDLLVWKWMRDNVRISASGDSTHVVVRLERPALHPWWAARVPVAIQMPGVVKRALLKEKALPVVNGQIQIDWPM
jgi:peptidoglycan/xylan/chitin deacetylase (PgdA/CDA1 family)